MTSLADKAILSGADNRPPMLEKDMYDSWKSRIELYMLNRQHVRMILESFENGPLLWPTIEENEMTRPKKYYELSTMEAIQADCDVKATNIILQGLPPEVYALVITHKVAKELSKRTQMLMQGTSLMKQERECKFCSSTTMDTTIDQQVAMGEALVPHAHRLRIGRSNFHLLSDIKSKESTLQLMYDVPCMTPFFKAFLVTADVLKIYMQEFWAIATVHHHSIQFKMDNKKHI
nr:hypothetical protein [Tanacetum cinerariifolium]